ncbi:MAG: hypothetical protein D6B25_16640 [Desulfobulbaceae bacterium]|nr:MAG: hypothetical protein D6B25_16640 [Desulfobulbaceae bacterium]
MEPILTRQEIDDLLQAIREGKISTDVGGDLGSGQQIDFKEINLFQVSSQREDKIRIPNFDIIIDAFAQNYAISLSNHLQRNFSITRTSLDSMPFQEYMLSKKNPGSIGVLNLSPLKHGALMLFDPQLSFSFIEIMLGASSDLEIVQLDRSLTKIEMTVLKAIMSKAGDDLDRAFRPITKLETSILKLENNPRLVSITDQESEVIISTFKVSVGEQSGTMEMVFPLATLDPFREEFKDLISVNTLKHGGWTDIIIKEVQDMMTTIVAQSGVVNLSVGQVMNFKVGDIIPVDYDINGSLKVLVEEKHKFFGQPGLLKGKKAISLIATMND